MTGVTDPLLRVRDLKVHFPLGSSFFGSKSVVKAVDGVSLTSPRAAPLASWARAARAKAPPRWP